MSAEGFCRFCGARVLWAKTTTGKSIPLELGRGFAGTYRISEGADGTVYASRVPVGQPASDDRYRTHMATCSKMKRRAS